MAIKTIKRARLLAKFYTLIGKRIPGTLEEENLYKNSPHMREGGGPIYWTLNRIPEKYRTEKICRIALEKHGLNLKYVPEELKTEDLCHIAVNQNCEALKYVPKKIITAELCHIAELSYLASRLNDAPKKLRSPEICRFAVKKYGWTLLYVPKKLRTLKICRKAIYQNDESLKYVPKKLKMKFPKFLK